jgi:hypothetical protein
MIHGQKLPAILATTYTGAAIGSKDFLSGNCVSFALRLMDTLNSCSTAFLAACFTLALITALRATMEALFGDHPQIASGAMPKNIKPRIAIQQDNAIAV